MSIKKDAEELCLKVDDPWSDAMIQEAIDAKLNEDAEKPKKPTPKKAVPKKPTKADKVIRNISGGSLLKVYGRIVQPGGEYTPTAADLKEEKGGKRIDNAIKKGYLERG